jgi:hypothetical protein
VVRKSQTLGRSYCGECCQTANLDANDSNYAEIKPNCNDEDCIARFEFGDGWPGGIHLATPPSSIQF